MARKKVQEVESDQYSKLETYCIWLNEYYESLRKAGFKDDVALAMLQSKESFPEWVSFKDVTKADIVRHVEDEED
jgi:hypothetical protein